MALTNDQITAQNFKDFYNHIMPYLNGQPALNYSTDEQIIGTWIDGKPLYQKTFETTTPSNNTDTLIVELPSNCIARSFDGYILQSGYNHMPLNAYYSSAEFVCTYMQFNPENGIRMKCENTQWRSHTAVITVRYTKTTD